MAESLLLPVVRGVVGKAADALVQRVARMCGVDDDRRKLERHLVYVQSLLADAEVKAETNGAVRAWIKALKTAAYQADDVLDNFKDLKNVLDKIDELVAEMRKFDLVVRAEAPLRLQVILHRQTHSVLDESMVIFGRDDNKDDVVKILLDQQDQDNVQVLPIIRMGGLGKTTLAKMVFNDSRKVIGRKRYLLILDDVWNEEQQKWEDSLMPLLCSSVGGLGSLIVVTSRSHQVAEIMGTLPHHELACLSKYDSWELFSKRAFSNGGPMQTELVTIGKHIVNKCKGVPLSLKTMGGLMSSMHQVQEWETIAVSNIGDTVRGKNEILSILKLSYGHLSPEMKQCFAFCAIYPKDYDMEKDKLIQLWIANGFIHEDGIMDLEKKDGCGIDELRDLRQLSRKLELYNLRNVKSGSKANLHEKRINELLLDWDHERSDIHRNDVANERQVLESLVPPSELELLVIRGYRGLAISQWMRDPQMFRCLRKLEIYDCPMCIRPMDMPLGCWPSLVRLELGLLVNLAICLEEQQGQSQTPLANLSYMMVNGEDAFVSIFDLPKLRLSLGAGMACLENLEIWNGGNIVRWRAEELQYLRRLQSLSISRFKRLERISFEGIFSLPLLETLRINFCDSLREIQELPTSLERVEIENCERLVALPSNIGNLARLRVLCLGDCGRMEALPNGTDGLTSLEKLEIWSCPRIEEFPPGLLRRLPHLKKLTVRGSTDGLKRRRSEGGEYFDLLSSIPSKCIW
ncbi:hypothetical protein U9M48_037968 [Paspalum notatum var. saurae]|uniref:Uncharacterized protein n=1 Tax=Paspalum notatum var. saurae TaxID=547442 RepID=A0AAQ3UH43_PASNO